MTNELINWIMQKVFSSGQRPVHFGSHKNASLTLAPVKVSFQNG